MIKAGLLGLGVIFGVVGVVSAIILAPWAFVGPPENTPHFPSLAIALSPLAVAVVLIVIGLRMRSPTPAEPKIIDPTKNVEPTDPSTAHPR